MATVINEALTLSPVTGTWSLGDVEGGGGVISSKSTDKHNIGEHNSNQELRTSRYTYCDTLNDCHNKEYTVVLVVCLRFTNCCFQRIHPLDTDSDLNYRKHFK